MDYKKIAIVIAIIALPAFYIWNTATNPSRIESRDGVSSTPTNENASKINNNNAECCPSDERNNTSAGPIYSIWVRSFRDSDGDGNGDLRGITERLDYISDLGVKTLLLSPIFPSPAYHGYEVTDYKSIASEYGSLEDLKLLLKESQIKGLNVYLDLPINHTSDQHPWFKASAHNDRSYRDYYIWKSELPANFGLPWAEEPDPLRVFHTKSNSEGFYYGVFGYASPDLNYQNPNVINEIKQILKFWINLGIDGFRLDAARYLIESGPQEGQRDTQENKDLLKELTTYAKSLNKNVKFISEVYASREIVNSYSKAATGIDYQFDFEVGPFISSVVNSPETTTADTIKTLRDTLTFLISTTKDINDKYIFLESHDFPRTNFRSTGEACLAHSLLLSLPYNFSLYYGEEIRLPGYSNDRDLFYRDSMIWNDSSKVANWNLDLVDNQSNYLTWKSKKYTQQDRLLREYISRLMKIRSHLKVFNSNDTQINFDLSTSVFLVATLASKQEIAFAITNVDTEFSHEFSFKKMPAQQYRLEPDQEIINNNTSLEVAPGESIIVRAEELR